MKLRAHQSTYQAPPLGLIVSLAIVTPSGDCIALTLATAEELIVRMESHNGREGLPTHYALLSRGNLDTLLAIYPVPDHDYDLQVHYYPPLQTL